MDISYSSLEQFLNCSQSYTLERVLNKNVIKRGFESQSGQAKHHLLAQMISERYNIPYSGEMSSFSFQELEEARFYLNSFDYEGVIGDAEVLAIEVSHYISINVDTRASTKLDLIVKHKDNSLEIIDWKFGRLVSEPEDDNQGNFYTWAVMDKYNVDEVKFTKYFVHYRDAKTKVYIKNEISRFKNYLNDVIPFILEVHENPSESIACVSNKCTTCKVQHHCSVGEEVSSDPEELTASVSLLKLKIKDIELKLKTIANSTDGRIELCSGDVWEYKASNSVSLKKGKISKLELCQKLVKDYPTLVAKSEGVEIKLDSDLVDLAVNNYNVSFITKTTNRFGFKSASKG